MRLMLEIWGDEADLALAEIKSIFIGERVRYNLIENDFPVIVIDAESWKPLIRAGLLRRVCMHIESGETLPEISMNLEDFAVRARVYYNRRRDSASALEKKVGTMIKGNVNLTSPSNIVRVAYARRYHIGLQLYEFSSAEFESRKSRFLPISYPITMHPRFARFLVNLAHIQTGAKVLDPFCGTGSILIEAGLMDMKIHGSDIDPKMVDAAKINLSKFGISGELKILDVGDIGGHYNAVVTDPPYGRSSSSKGENIHKLYDRAFQAFSRVTDKVAIALPDKDSLKIGEQYFDLKEYYPQRVHKSLTRYFAYFEK